MCGDNLSFYNTEDNPDKTEGAIKNGQSRETGNIGHIRH
jgi:hypothetical protein